MTLAAGGDFKRRLAAWVRFVILRAPLPNVPRHVEDAKGTGVAGPDADGRPRPSSSEFVNAALNSFPYG
jgi:hypothetical protein